ncbi:MAG: class C sortase [Clostridiales bacterium]|nr:class C sortase [Clostridiales bacterium]
MKSKWMTIVLILVMVAGLSLLLYPSFASYWNTNHATRTIATYSEDISVLKEDRITEIWQNAVEYNKNFRGGGGAGGTLTEEQLAAYNALLNIGDTGMMGFIDIDCLNVSLPIYHGTSEGVLQVAAGHLDWTSLPVGGEGTHCVISGHRGLPSAKLFSDLDKLHEGQTFTLTVLDTVLTYEIDQIRIVEPENISDLVIVPGKDYCTLLTCTPYGVNTHRLLVRGHRITTPENSLGARVTSEAMQIEPLIVASLMAVPPLLVLLILVFSRKKKSPTFSEVRNREEVD